MRGKRKKVIIRLVKRKENQNEKREKKKRKI